MPDRISIDIEGYRGELEKLAVDDERTLNQMIRIMIKEGIERRVPKSDIPASEFLRRLEEKNLPQNGELVVAAHEIGVSVELLKALCDCVRNHDGVKARK